MLVSTMNRSKTAKKLLGVLTLFGGILGLVVSIRGSLSYLNAVNDGVPSGNALSRHFSLELLSSSAMWSFYLTTCVVILIMVSGIIKSK